jgi:pimeloyl-ACP methyl ester carboxylesterase
MEYKVRTIRQLVLPGNRLAIIVIGIAAIFLLFGCGSSSSSSSPPPPVAGQLVSWSPAATFTASQLNFGIQALGITGITATSDAACYKLTYETPDPIDSLVHASGLVCVPMPGSSNRPVISYQHGTIFQDSDAPSHLTLSTSTSYEGLIGAALAGLGFIAVLPDYLGFGESAGMMHPYLHAETLASATVNMNRAARTFFADPAINASSNGQLFLAGYSEGGYATLATQRLMEQSLSAEFPLIAAESGDGPYDLTGTAAYVVGLTNQVEPAFTGFFLKAYDSLYNDPSQIDYYFSSAYTTTVNTYFDGTHSRSDISTALGGPGVATTTLLNPVFVSSYLGLGEASLKAHIAENDIYNWAPAVPTRLFHGVDDDIVPYANATTAQTAMTNNGSTTVTLVDCDAGALPTNHDNCVIPFAIDVITYFKTLATGL